MKPPTCACNSWLLEAQPYIERIHALMAEIIPNVHIARLPCGHIGVGTVEEITDEWRAAFHRATGLSGAPPPSDIVRVETDYEVIR